MKENKSTEFILKEAKELIPYANNSRLHSSKHIKQIASSIKEFGFLNPIIIDEQNGVIAGHGRLEASIMLGIKNVPCILAKDLTEAQKKAYIIADNKLTDNSTFDEDMLKVELATLKELEFDLSLTGFEEKEINELLTIDDDLECLEKYNRKIESPIYEIKGEKPKIEDLVDTSKTDELISKIEKADIDEKTKDYLRMAAQRHLVFNYTNAAEFYAHQSKEVQELMEDSALVIIDFNQAIENGFAYMNKQLQELASSEDN